MDISPTPAARWTGSSGLEQARPKATISAPAATADEGAGVRGASGTSGGRAQCRSAHRRRSLDSGVSLDIEVSVVGTDRHDEVMKKTLEPGQPEWVGPRIAKPDRCIPGELIGT